MPPSPLHDGAQLLGISMLHQKADETVLCAMKLQLELAFFLVSPSSWRLSALFQAIMSAEQEVASLDRVLLRLGSTPEASLEQVWALMVLLRD